MNYDPPYHLKELKLEVTQRCPLNCLHCSSEARPTADQEMTRDAAKRLISEATAIGVEELVLSGGEALVHPNVEDLVTAASGIPSVGIYTTGHIARGQPMPSARWAALARLGVGKVVFSLNGATRESHERVTRVSGSFDVTTRSIRSAVDAGLAVECHFVPLRHNYGELPRLAELAVKLGIRRLSLLRFVLHGRGRVMASRSALSPADHAKLCAIVDGLGDEGVGVRLGSPYNILLRNRDVWCKAAVTCMTVGPNGNAYPCDAFKRIEPTQIGLEDRCHDALTSGLRDVWERSSYFEAVRTQLRGGPGQDCRKCGYVTLCKSGCLAQKVIHYEGLTDLPDPDCFGRWRGHRC